MRRSYDANVERIYRSAAIYFDRDNVGLPGVSMFFKVAGVCKMNEQYKIADWLNKRGRPPRHTLLRSLICCAAFDHCTPVDMLSECLLHAARMAGLGFTANVMEWRACTCSTCMFVAGMLVLSNTLQCRRARAVWTCRRALDGVVSTAFAHA